MIFESINSRYFLKALINPNYLLRIKQNKDMVVTKEPDCFFKGLLKIKCELKEDRRNFRFILIIMIIRHVLSGPDKFIVSFCILFVGEKAALVFCVNFLCNKGM